MKKHILLYIFFVLFIGCTSEYTSSEKVTNGSPLLSEKLEVKRNVMIGKWYGFQPLVKGGSKEHLVERYSNGQYKIAFRITDNEGTIKDSEEVGYWGISGNIYFTIFKGWLQNNKVKYADPSSPYNYDAYEILYIDESKFEYKHIETGNSYIIKKVSDDFDLK